jgi:ribonuclease VapC
MKTHVLDANALFQFLQRGPGADTVRQLFKQAREFNGQIQMSVINWGEVHYSIARHKGIKAATAILDKIDELPLMIVGADLSQTRTAANLKASYGVPYADCFAAALAGRSGVLVTADTKDFGKIPWLELLPIPSHKRNV